MWLKIIILFLFIALVISLFTGLGFLIKNKDNEEQSRALWNTLTVRLILVTLLLGFIFYGVYTGKLGSNAPWDARYSKQIQPVSNSPDNKTIE